MPAPKKNQNAMRGESPATSTVQFRVTPREKAALVKAAHPGKLTEWIRKRIGLDK